MQTDDEERAAFVTMWRDRLASRMNHERIPLYMHGGFLNYVIQGVPPGAFLQAVFKNDLMDALKRADNNNLSILHLYGSVMYNHAPRGCYGSLGAYENWIGNRGLVGFFNRELDLRRRQQAVVSTDPDAPPGQQHEKDFHG